MNYNENNIVNLVGEISSSFRFSHEVMGEKFYLFDLAIERRSKVADVLPIMVSERIIDVTVDCVGAIVSVDGELRTFNTPSENRNGKVVVTVFAKDIENVTSNHANHIELTGFLCKEPVYRETPLGREVTDFILAVNRPYGKSDYIPCIAWGRDARYIAMHGTGSKITLEGRVQSREYKKKYSEDVYEMKIAYEVSVGKLTEVLSYECED